MNLEDLMRCYNFRQPDRGMDAEDDDVKWRYGRKPNYNLADARYMRGKTQNHEPGSTGEFVENLIKKWEMEASHKCDFAQWKTVNHANYSIQGSIL